ncbi:hypothetical protein SAMN02910325_00649 [Ruminococcus flavefaciens]|uniref:Uncharacterized protein n=1 Tax=Ruminococcus flavefaciens TaxID=1265 RepID=A0A315Y4G1_RUMFL|nr:hypothetical protein IE37_00649 [Ruminococcus flavefaciens]SSA42694.1 hypothetical protein SAMN02910325_00649 [Ruminococcus flavefaciens]
MLLRKVSVNRIHMLSKNVSVKYNTSKYNKGKVKAAAGLLDIMIVDTESGESYVMVDRIMDNVIEKFLDVE